MIGLFNGRYVCSDCGYEWDKLVDTVPVKCLCQEKNVESEEIPYIPFNDISRFSFP